MNSSRFWTRRMSTSEAGRKPRTPRSRIRPPLTTSITVPSTGSPESAAFSIRRHAFSKRARFLERIRRPSWSSLVRTRASTSSPSSTSSDGIDRLADRELVGGDDPLRLVADVDQHLVLVDAHDLAAHHVPLAEGVDGGVVVGDELAVDLDQQVVGARGAVAGGLLGGLAAARSAELCWVAQHPARFAQLGCRVACGHGRTVWQTHAAGTGPLNRPRPGFHYLCERCRNVRPSAAISARR